MFNKWMDLTWKEERKFAASGFAKSAWSSLQDGYADEPSSQARTNKQTNKQTGSLKQPCCEVWRWEFVCWGSGELNPCSLSKQMTWETLSILKGVMNLLFASVALWMVDVNIGGTKTKQVKPLCLPYGNSCCGSICLHMTFKAFRTLLTVLLSVNCIYDIG